MQQQLYNCIIYKQIAYS